jgi:hypothetical protein
MPHDGTDIVDVFLFTLAAVIGGFATAAALHAWRSWSEHRRIEKHLGRR